MTPTHYARAAASLQNDRLILLNDSSLMMIA